MKCNYFIFWAFGVIHQACGCSSPDLFPFSPSS